MHVAQSLSMFCPCLSVLLSLSVCAAVPVCLCCCPCLPVLLSLSVCAAVPVCLCCCPCLSVLLSLSVCAAVPVCLCCCPCLSVLLSLSACATVPVCLCCCPCLPVCCCYVTFVYDILGVGSNDLDIVDAIWACSTMPLTECAFEDHLMNA